MATPGGFNPANGVYSVKNVSDISGSFPEEYIHAFQQEMYAGIEKYSGLGRSNIEFEAKLIQDISCVYTDGGCLMYGAGEKYGTQYVEWIYEITDSGNKTPNFDEIVDTPFKGLTYWDFLEDYVTKVPEYNKGTDRNLEPKAIKELITHFKC
jgi:hypothetical protein